MKAGVLIFPGSNCDQDMVDALRGPMDWEVCELWHKDASLPAGLDAIAVPGGFSYGDYLRAGAIARFSPIMKPVVEFANKGGCVFGVCNGFQVLTEIGLLPGALHRNQALRFRCTDVHLRVERKDTMFTTELGDVVSIPIAHGEGNYFIDQEGLARLEGEGQVLFRYATAGGEVTPEANANGSTASIAGICNKAGNVLGMMPHPERACDLELGSADGKGFFRSIERALSASALAQ